MSTTNASSTVLAGSLVPVAAREPAGWGAVVGGAVVSCSGAGLPGVGAGVGSGLGSGVGGTMTAFVVQPAETSLI